ncbi:MAG: hypothetical protein QM784_35115 [Polyangiaceae bacterium]
MRNICKLSCCAVIGFASVVSACGERTDALDAAPSVVGRAQLKDELLYVDETDGWAHAVDVMTDEPRAKADRIDIPAHPTRVVERPSEDEVLVLCAGERDTNGDWIEKPALVAIDAKHQKRTYTLSTPLTKMNLTQDGRFALLHTPGSDGSSGELLSNPNRVVLVDLSAKASDSNPVERTLKAPGSELANVYLFDDVRIGGTSRPIGLFTFGDGISIWDLSHPERAEIASEGLGSGGSVTLSRIVADGDHGTFYLIQQRISDLRVLNLDNPIEGKENDFWPSWNQLPLDSNSASDLVLYEDHQEPRVLVAVSNQVRIIDSNDSRVVPINTPAAVQRFYSFEGAAPNDPESKQRVLGWAQGATAFVFIELTDLESRGTRNMEVVEVGASIREVLPLSSLELIVSFANGGIGVFDLQNRRFTPFTSTVELTSALIESDGKRVWVGAAADRQVGYFEPRTLEASSMRLDDPIQEMFLFESGSKRRIVVAHDDPWGKFTVVDGAKLSRANATVVEGFLLDGVVK